MHLTDEQKQKVAAWIADGAKLSDIQNRIAEEFDIRLTYMDVRFLADDLKVMPKDAPEPPKPAPAEAPAPR
jgi:transposase